MAFHVFVSKDVVPLVAPGGDRFVAVSICAALNLFTPLLLLLLPETTKLSLSAMDSADPAAPSALPTMPYSSIERESPNTDAVPVDDAEAHEPTSASTGEAFKAEAGVLMKRTPASPPE